jgi:hypothetical protein
MNRDDWDAVFSLVFILIFIFLVVLASNEFLGRIAEWFP